MSKDVEHLKCFSVVRDSSIENSLFRSLPLLLIGLFDLLVSSFLSSLCIGPVSDVKLVKIFSHSVGFCFVLLTKCLLLTAFQIHLLSVLVPVP